jgi:S-methylmethionine-dependent homocysteine/selenocysteine methylase
MSADALTILDGAMGAELARRGVDIGLPLWSANALLTAPHVVQQIHADYAAAGATVLTANTFRTNARTLERAGLSGQSRELTFKAVTLARQVAARLGIRVAGSMAPVEDCYSPWLIPQDEAVLLREHSELAHDLADAGCDLLLIETMNTVREAAAAAQAARATGLPVWVSFILGPDHHLLSGEPLREAIQAVLPFKPQAVLLNCLPVAQVADALALLRTLVTDASVVIGAYANAGHVEDGNWSLAHGVTPDDYAQAAQTWQALGANIIGGCCGTTPAHIRAVMQALRPS